LGAAVVDHLAQVELRIDPEEGMDAEELSQLTSRLREELLELDVEGADLARAEIPTSGTKAADVAKLGTLIVTLATSSTLLTALVKTITSFLSRHQHRTAKLRIDNDVLELTGLSSRAQQRVIEDWIGRHNAG
jgi:hypothetical protein